MLELIKKNVSKFLQLDLHQFDINFIKYVCNVQEQSWQTALMKLSSDLSDKIDKFEFNDIRSDVEKQLRALSIKMAALNKFVSNLTNDDAAGIRK